MATTPATTELPKYKSHKTVQAVKILAIEQIGETDRAMIIPEDTAYTPIEVTAEYLAKHSPAPGGYYVLYSDGYHSYSPAEAFESGYTLLRASARKPKILTIELENQIAIVCWETNRIYCGTIGDKPLPYWTDATKEETQSYKNGVSAHWTVLDRGEEPTPEESHNNWLRQKRQEGWTYGETKDPAAKTHPCFKPYNDLPPEQRLKDYLFIGVVKAFYFAN